MSMSKSTRHPHLWFSDGSVVLKAETTLFKVHRSTLMTHSNFFADMFRLPQPANQEMVAGCPLVDVPDRVVYFECFLKAIYDRK